MSCTSAVRERPRSKIVSYVSAGPGGGGGASTGWPVATTVGGRRGLGSVGGGSGRVLRPKPRHTEQPCNKGEQDCPARTADRRPPHRAPPGTRRAIPVCLRERPWPRPGCAQTRLHLRRFHEATAGSLPVR